MDPESAQAIRAYERDPYLTELDTEVVGRGSDGARHYLLLADSVLYPEGGGQPSDRGWVAGVAVEEVRGSGQTARHYVAGPVAADRVRLVLDWARRFDHMQQHTAQHLLTAVAMDRFQWATTAFHLGQTLSDIELDTPGITAEQLDALEEAVALEIRAARPVTAQRVSRQEFARLAVRTRGLPEGHTGDVRLVEIAGVDRNTCGGTHVRSTAEIETLKLLGSEPMRGGTRLHFAAGRRVRGLLGAHLDRAAGLRTLLGAADEEVHGLVTAKLEQLRDAARRIRSLEEEVAALTARALAAGGKVGAAHWTERDMPFLQRVARELTALAPDHVALLTAGEGEQGAFVLAVGPAVPMDVAALGREIAGLLEGRGGGAGRSFQGKAGRLSRRQEALDRLRALVPDR
jgi:Ser-tRNA(Ala) deacylase AlaX